MVKVKNLSLIFSESKKEDEIIKDVSFTAKKGSITALIGKSGCGKTTILRCLAGQEPQYDGSITISNKEIKNIASQECSKMVSMVFQSFNLFPHLTIIDNCIQPLVSNQKLSLEEAKERSFEALTTLDLLDFAKSYPTELTTEQQQKVAIAKALSLKPKLLLLDEPTTTIDLEDHPKLSLTLDKISKNGITIIFSSSDNIPSNTITTDTIHLINEGQITKTINSKNLNANYKNKNILRFFKPHLFD